MIYYPKQKFVNNKNVNTQLRYLLHSYLVYSRFRECECELK